MDPASLALGVVGVIDICFKYGKKLLRSLRSFCDNLDYPLLVIYHDALTRLGAKLAKASESFQVIQAKAGVSFHVQRKVKAVYLKRELARTVEEFEQWQRRFDPSWYLITRIANPDIDVQLRDVRPGQQPGVSASAKSPSPTMRLAQMRASIKQISSQGADQSGSVFKNAAFLSDEMVRVEGTDAYVTKYKSGNASPSPTTARRVLLDPANLLGLNQVSTTTAKQNIRDLARLLQHIDLLTFHLLRCEGVVELPTLQGNQFYLLFEIPKSLQQSTPKTLRCFLSEIPKAKKCSLTLRVQSSKQLARSVIAEGRTDKFGDLDWAKNLYRHPLRQGLYPEEIFEMRHDIYSLGVCLLEIALWESFVCVDHKGNSTPWSGLEISSALVEKDQRRGAFRIKDRLVELCKTQLPALIGERYTAVVVACLCCLDESKDNVFWDETSLQDRDGIVVGVRYIDNVLLKLEELVI
ncbi:uncharacterized protein BDW70DRAFT_166308 [Aspergillus foveolatus]|uniref:uncharacterized protein n=1 Tax=Aspergillus foveolatus TaxID=210207 RepID=UPI003CCE274B